MIKTILLLTYFEKLYHIFFRFFFSTSPYVMQNQYMNLDRLCYVFYSF